MVPSSVKSSPMAEVTILSSATFSIVDAPDTTGHINNKHSFLLRDILESGIGLRVSCSFESGGRGRQGQSEKRKLLPCNISIALYAPFSRLEEIKEWSDNNEVYLQDPTFCLQDAKYCNPQRLSRHFEAARMVSEVLPQASEHRMQLRSIADDDDFLDKYLASKIELEETAQPSAIRTALKRCVNLNEMPRLPLLQRCEFQKRIRC